MQLEKLRKMKTCGLIMAVNETRIIWTTAEFACYAVTHIPAFYVGVYA
jgi:hypothetical protein